MQVNVKQEELLHVSAYDLRHPIKRKASVRSIAPRRIFVISQRISPNGPFLECTEMSSPWIGLQALAGCKIPDVQCYVVPALDRDQHLRQTEGWESSWEHLERVLSTPGPFDGIMGFSQVGMQAFGRLKASSREKLCGTQGTSELGSHVSFRVVCMHDQWAS